MLAMIIPFIFGRCDQVWTNMNQNKTLFIQYNELDMSSAKCWTLFLGLNVLIGS